MCNLYHVSPKDELAKYLERHASQWELPNIKLGTVGPNQAGLYVRELEGVMAGTVGQWGMIRPGQPERIDYMPSKSPGKRGRPRSTNNARVETVHTRPTFRAAWQAGQRCLVPASWYQEPNWETGRNIWWQLKRVDGQPWMLAGLWSEWTDPSTGEIVPNFTMLTTNCDGHPLLGRLHKPVLGQDGVQLPTDQQDKRSLVHVDPENGAQWLQGNEREARELIRPQPAEVFDQSDAARTDRELQALKLRASER